jgi:hypothetical protein
MFFVNPGVRFSRRNRVCQSRVRSVLFRRFIDDAGRRCLRLGSRVYEAEFPLARLIVYRFMLFLERMVSGSRATDCASNDALRPFNNWVKPEDQYGISFIGEKWPASARRLPQKGRQQSPAPAECAFARTGEEIAPAANHGPFHRRRKAGGETSAGTTAAAATQQWCGANVAAFA